VSGLAERYVELFEGDGDTSQHQANFAKKWKGYATIVELACGDIQKIDEVTNLPLEQCLLFLSYKSDKNVLENLMHKEAMKGIG
jgi:hypothetical protein